MLSDTIIDDPRWNDIALDGLVETAAQATLQHLGLDPAMFEICVLACDDTRIATLNADFRGKPAPTNVLSWPAFDLAPQVPGASPDNAPQGSADDPESLGDIAIAFGICTDEARAAGKPMHAHVTHLIVHGVLHLLGYDHIRDPDATLMESLETTILGKMGLPDPYDTD